MQHEVVWTHLPCSCGLYCRRCMSVVCRTLTFGTWGAQERFRRWSVAQTARAEEERAASAFLAAQRQPSADPLAQRLRSVALREDSESGSELGADAAADAESGALRCPLVKYASEAKQNMAVGCDWVLEVWAPLRRQSSCRLDSNNNPKQCSPPRF